MFSLLILTSALAQETSFVRSLDRKALGQHKKDKLTFIQVYFHEIFKGPNATTVAVVPPLPQFNSTANFGEVGVSDVDLTAGPEPGSKVVGKLEGMFSATSKTEFSILVTGTFVFTEGKYNKSSITVLGRNRPFQEEEREIPVIGGTGLFRFATGFAKTRTLFIDPQRSTIVYDIYVSHH
ncbi:hypothetical protein VNO78_25586 [Psophocarpus tetragonolobus]|uniref:Dirigent protein n=1 Tax=Psophocarpus tetragonolobus TaxID=3891 RepID=A0AAN9XFY1_PSOTE